MKSARLNRTHYAIKGKVDILIDLENTVEIGVELWELQGNEYRKTAFKLAPRGVCDAYAEDHFCVPDFIAVSDLPEDRKTCPIPKKVYTFTDYIFDPANLPKIMNGKYKVHIYFTSNGKKVDYANAYIQIIRFTVI